MEINLPIEVADPSSRLEAAIEAEAPEVGAVVRDWVVVASWEDSDGCRFITGNTNAAAWDAQGLLHWVLDTGVLIPPEFSDDDAC